MRLFVVLFIALLPLAASERPSEPKPAPKATSTKAVAPKNASAKTAAAPKVVEIPAGAVETQPGSFTYTDPQGKKWLYWKTPFGIARKEDKPAEGLKSSAATMAVTEKVAEKVKVVEDGDVVRFERPGPFGLYKWERKKSELTDDERGWLERERTRAAARQD